jgi:hypothetical protein
MPISHTAWQALNELQAFDFDNAKCECVEFCEWSASVTRVEDSLLKRQSEEHRLFKCELTCYCTMPQSAEPAVLEVEF